MTEIFKNFGAVDYLALGLAAFLVLRGLIRGGSGEIGRLAGAVIAAAAGYFTFAPVARLVQTSQVFHANLYAGRLVAFILVAVVCLALWLALRRLLADVIRLGLAQPFDALLGGMIGGIKAFLLLAVLCTLGLLLPRESSRTRFQRDSVTVQKIAPLLKRITSPDR